MSQPATPPDAFWETIPRRLLRWQKSDSGLCVLLRPKLGKSRVGRWVASRFGDPHYRIKLDEFGTFVWNACDGETSLGTIAARLRDQFGRDIEPAEERLALFVRRMLRSRILELTVPPAVLHPIATSGRDRRL